MAKRKGKRGSPYIKPLDASIHPLAHLFIKGFRFVLNKADLEFLGSDKSKFVMAVGILLVWSGLVGAFLGQRNALRAYNSGMVGKKGHGRITLMEEPMHSVQRISHSQGEHDEDSILGKEHDYDNGAIGCDGYRNTREFRVIVTK
ncbi:hypothetical protein CK203_045122 [Vitis vinifera]|uniref:Uncharacterized protein n=1 Tax=Vitis vinifera TaxID=29760 RepID=A0A438HD01_VITVI|nr:hypothetical protein CK203_045122 [Vitis vinifera]